MIQNLAQAIHTCGPEAIEALQRIASSPSVSLAGETRDYMALIRCLRQHGYGLDYIDVVLSLNVGRAGEVLRVVDGLAKETK